MRIIGTYVPIGGVHMIQDLQRNLGNIVEIIYQGRSGEISQRCIRIDVIEGDVVRAYCFTRRAVRTFSLSSILALAQTRRGLPFSSRVGPSSTQPSKSCHKSPRLI